MLDEILVEVGEELNGYPKSFKKEGYQMYRRYRACFGLHYAMIANVHPLWSVGKDRIATWREAVDRYEALSGRTHPLVAVASKDTAYMIEHLIPKEFLDLMGNPRRYMLVAMRYVPSQEEIDSYVDFVIREMNESPKDKNGDILGDIGSSIDYESFKPSRKKGGVVPAGVLSFVIDEIDGDPVARIEWLYVAKRHRNLGMANALMTKMLYILKDIKGLTVLADLPQSLIEADGEPHVGSEPADEGLRAAGFPMEEEKEEEFEAKAELPPIVHFFTNWKFEGGLIPEEAVRVKISSIEADKRKLVAAMDYPKIHTLDELDDDSYRMTLNRLMKLYPNMYDRELTYVDRGRFERDLSCFFKGERGETEGLCLVYIDRAGNIVIEMAQTLTDDERVFSIMLHYVIAMAKGKYMNTTNLIIPLRQERMVKALESIVPSVTYRTMLRAALIEPADDITTEEWESVTDELAKIGNDDLYELAKALTEDALNS